MTSDARLIAFRLDPRLPSRARTRGRRRYSAVASSRLGSRASCFTSLVISSQLEASDAPDMHLQLARWSVDSEVDIGIG